MASKRSPKDKPKNHFTRLHALQKFITSEKLRKHDRRKL